MRSPFTAAQWQEMEHQALILKYMLAGVPLTPDLVLTSRRGFGSVPALLYQNPALAYCSYFGKKLDPEPGRCRRTDGKKWRCAKDAYPDSKYCEHHMHRGKNRSRKHVESQSLSQLQNSSLSTSSKTSGSNINNSMSPYSVSRGANTNTVNMSSYGNGGINEYRYQNGVQTELGLRSFMPEASRSTTLDGSILSYSQLSSAQEMGCQSRSTYFQESNSPQPFFNEWPKTRDLWSDLEDERSNQISFSNTQLSISIPMTSSDFSSTASGPNYL